jgi:hypothetical protein
LTRSSGQNPELLLFGLRSIRTSDVVWVQYTHRLLARAHLGKGHNPQPKHSMSDRSGDKNAGLQT